MVSGDVGSSRLTKPGDSTTWGETARCDEVTVPQAKVKRIPHTITSLSRCRSGRWSIRRMALLPLSQLTPQHHYRLGWQWGLRPRACRAQPGTSRCSPVDGGRSWQRCRVGWASCLFMLFAAGTVSQGGIVNKSEQGIQAFRPPGGRDRARRVTWPHAGTVFGQQSAQWRGRSRAHPQPLFTSADFERAVAADSRPFAEIERTDATGRSLRSRAEGLGGGLQG